MLVPENPVVGGTALRRAAIQSPNFVTGSTGWAIRQDGSAEFNNLVVRGGTIISGTALYYSSSPPVLGTLVASVAAAAGTDTPGNAYLAGETSYTTVGGKFYAVSNNGASLQFFESASAAGPWGLPIASIVLNTSNNADLNFGTNGNILLKALQSILNPATLTIGSPTVLAFAGLLIQSALAATPAAPASGVELWTGTSGATMLQAIKQSGQTGNVPMAQSNGVTFTVTGLGPSQGSKAWSIPSGDAIGGSLYRLTVEGFGTEGTTVDNLVAGVALNGATVESVTVAGLTPISAAFQWQIVILLRIRSSGVGGTADVSLSGTWSTTAAPSVTGSFNAGSPSSGAEAFDTTASNTLQLNLGWAAVTGGPTITSLGSLFEKLA